MGFVTSLRSWLAPVRKDAGSASLPSQGYLPTLGGSPSSTGLVVSQATAMAVSTVYACVTIRSQDVARCTPRLYRRDSRGRRVLVTDHPLNRLFRRPNSQQTWFEWTEQMNGAYLLRGNAYAARLGDDRGVTRELIPVNPDAVLVAEAWDGQIFYNVNRIGLWQLAKLRNLPPMIAEEDVLHLRGITFNSLVGGSTIGFARDAIGVAMGLEQQTARWMNNGSRPSVILQTPKKLNEEAGKRLKQSWRDLTQGLNNTGNTAVLEDGVEAKVLSLTSVDLEFMAQRDFSVADILRFYRVPLHKVAAEQMRGVNLVQMDQDYVSNTIMPDLHRWEQKFDRDFELAEQGLEIDMDETALLRADIQTRYNAARIALLSGWTTVNEIRAGEDLDPVEGGDQVYRPLNMAALGSDVTGTSPDGAGRPSTAEGDTPGADNVPTTSDDQAKTNRFLAQTLAETFGVRFSGEDAEVFLRKTLAGEDA